MSSSTKEHGVQKSEDETRVQTASREPTTKRALEHFQEYGRDRPEIVALWCLGIGFVLGWKLKMW